MTTRRQSVDGGQVRLAGLSILVGLLVTAGLLLLMGRLRAAGEAPREPVYDLVELELTTLPPPPPPPPPEEPPPPPPPTTLVVPTPTPVITPVPPTPLPLAMPLALPDFSLDALQGLSLPPAPPTAGGTVLAPPAPLAPSPPPTPAVAPPAPPAPPPPPVPRGPYREDEVDQPPTVLLRERPVYPSQARRLGLEGWVVVSFVVDALGQVHEVQVVQSSSSRFHDAVLAAVPRWRFNPGLRHGQAVAVRCQTRLNFTLAD